MQLTGQGGFLPEMIRAVFQRTIFVTIAHFGIAGCPATRSTQWCRVAAIDHRHSGAGLPKPGSPQWCGQRSVDQCRTLDRHPR